MSEHQYYEFQAVDRPLDVDAQSALRAISTRARVTATSFVNSYDWGDLKADPYELLKRYFDLFLYLANWGSRRIALRLPKDLVDLDGLDRFQLDDELVSLKLAGKHLLVDITAETDSDYVEDDNGWLASLAPLRTDLLAGDLRMFVLLWLAQVDRGWTADDAVMPAPGLETLSASLAALADFLGIDDDLLEVACRLAPVQAAPSTTEVEAAIRSLADDDKTALLRRVHDGDPYVQAELRRLCRNSAPATDTEYPTAGDLRAAAAILAAERRRLADEQAATRRRQHEQELAAAQTVRIANLAGRGEAAWTEVEEQIALRNANGYDQAAALLADLGEIAARNGTQDQFATRLADIRDRHSRKGNFIARLDKAGLS